MSERSAAMCRILRDEFDGDDVVAFVLANFADDDLRDLEKALELWNEMDRLEDIDAFVERKREF